MKRYKIKIEYDGVPFVGWQKQEKGLDLNQPEEYQPQNQFQNF